MNDGGREELGGFGNLDDIVLNEYRLLLSKLGFLILKIVQSSPVVEPANGLGDLRGHGVVGQLRLALIGHLKQGRRGVKWCVPNRHLAPH